LAIGGGGVAILRPWPRVRPAHTHPALLEAKTSSQLAKQNSNRRNASDCWTFRCSKGSRPRGQVQLQQPTQALPRPRSPWL